MTNSFTSFGPVPYNTWYIFFTWYDSYHMGYSVLVFVCTVVCDQHNEVISWDSLQSQEN